MPKVIVHGTDEVVAGFDKLSRELAQLEEPSRRIAAGLIPEIRARTPVRTGVLAVSWDVGTVRGGASISSPLDYALPIELGTRRGVEAHHMVRDTLVDHTDEVVAGYRDELADDARRIGFRVSR